MKKHPRVGYSFLTLMLILLVLSTGVFLATQKQKAASLDPTMPSSKANKTVSVAAKTQDDATVARAPQDAERELAATIRKLTNRSTEGLVEEPLPGGGYGMDLQERFQNVTLARVDENGATEAGCVTSLDEANEFFGKNLETGEAVSSARFRQRQDDAARHGMGVDEYQFYLNLIKDAEERRAAGLSAANIVIVNADGAGEGFNDPAARDPEGNNTGTTLGQQRLNLFNFAASIWGAYLDSTVTISVRSQFNSLTPCSTGGGVLGSAGTTNIYRDFSTAQFPNTWYHAALANKRTGQDQNGTNPEISATFNSDVDTGCLGAGRRFYYGLDNSTPTNTTNLLVVLLHEFGHGLGFQSFVNSGTGALQNGFPDIFTRYTFDRTTGLYWYQMTDAERQASAINTGNLLWDGPNVKIASGFLTAGRESSTGRVQLFAPNPVSAGSSVSHFDTVAFPNLLMEPNINRGLPTDLDLTRQQMRDIGWYRDATGDLVPDTIINVQPSGVNITAGSTVNITWTNTGGFNRNVTIELSTDGGATFPTVIATNIANTGSFAFTAPNFSTSQGRIRVREDGFVDPTGISASNFSITSNCSYAVSPTSQSFAAAGGSETVNVTAIAGCGWSASSNAGWLTITNGTTGSGNGTVNYTVAANNGAERTGILTIAGQIVTVTQSAAVGCSAASISAGQIISGVLTASDCRLPGTQRYADIYTFNAAAGQQIAVALNSVGNTPALDTYLYLLNASGQIIAENDDLNPGVSTNSRIPVTGFFALPATGTYIIYASSYSNNETGSYTISLTADNITMRPKTVGVFRPSNGIVYLKNANSGGFADLSLVYGNAGDQPIAGDWNGDGVDSLGIYRNGVFYLRNANTTGPADIVFPFFPFGAAGDIPIAGDWNGDGIDTIGVYRQSTGVFYLRNTNTEGGADVAFVLGNPGDVPIAGDWNGDGVTTTGVFRPTNGIIYLKNTNVSGNADIGLVYGNAGDKPVAGDWNGDGVDTVGIYRGGLFYLRNTNTQGVADLVFALGNDGDVPIAGDWDGLP